MAAPASTSTPMHNEEQRVQDTLDSMITALNKLKTRLQDLLMKLDSHGDQIEWPHYMNSFALCAADFNEIRRVLYSEKLIPLHTHCLVPICLNPDIDRNLVQLTDERLPCFSHEKVPDYLRTKLDPEVEEKRQEEISKSSTSSSDLVNRQINLLNQLVDNVSKGINKLRTDLDDSEVDLSLKRASNKEDTEALIAAVTFGKNS